MESINHTTVEGDRIDALAHYYYGSNKGVKIILDANQHVPITPVFPLGTVLVIPIVDDVEIVEKSTLPPWKS